MIYNLTQDTLKIQIQLLKKQINMERRSVSENIKEYVRIICLLLFPLTLFQNERLHRGERESRSSYFCDGQENEPLDGEGKMCSHVD